MRPSGARKASSTVDMDARRNFVEYICHNPTVSDSIFSFSCPATILCFSKTCRDARRAVLAYMRLAFEINRHLLRYFDDPIAFRRLQECTGLLVSGSSAVQFLGRLDEYPGSDIDLYVDTFGVKAAGDFLLDNGYVYLFGERDLLVPSEDFHDAVEDVRSWWNVERPQTLDYRRPGSEKYSTMPGVWNVFNFRREEQSPERPARFVQLFGARMCPMEIILRFHSTCVMNLISHKNAYSLYPRSTFSNHQSLVVEPDARSLTASMKKWAARGWHMVETQDERADVPEFQDGLRFVGDARTWVLPLDTDGLVTARSRTVSSDFLSVNSWSIKAGENHPRTEFDPLSASNLRYTYILSREDQCPAILKGLLDPLSAFVHSRRSLLGDTELSDYCCDSEVERVCEAEREAAARRQDLLINGLSKLGISDILVKSLISDAQRQ